MLQKALPKKDLMEVFGDTLDTILSQSDPELFLHTTPENVYQEAQKQNRHLFQWIMEELLEPESRVEGAENILELHALAQEGKSCLVLSSHVSNFDVPAQYTLYKKHSKELEQVFEDIIFIAGRKLTEDGSYVKSLAEMFTRIVIAAKTNFNSREEIQRALAINRASQKAISTYKRKGRVFYLYPTGTRIRPWVPQTYRGMREIYNYMRNFDYFCHCGVEGVLLPATDDRPMAREFPTRDTVVLRYGDVISTKDYMKNIESRIQDKEADKKQIVMDQVMEDIYKLGDDPRKKFAGPPAHDRIFQYIY